MLNKQQTNMFSFSEQSFDRKEDMYAYLEFGKIVNKYTLNDSFFSDEVWNYLKEKFALSNEDITVFCDSYTIIKNKIDKTYRYIVKVNKPHNLLFYFYDEEKSQDDKNLDEIDKKNKISSITIYFDGSNLLKYVEDLVEDLKSFMYVQPISKTFYVISTSIIGGYELRPANIKEFDVKIDLNYGSAFVDKYSEILDKLKNQKRGLFLFHGDSGTGKTTLIRKLVSDLSEDKTIIYIPSYFMWDLVNPELISFISKFKNAILLLEDAEMILTAAEDERTQAVSNILNITDGLLNDHMEMQVIATFNTTKKISDKALLRKGRLMVDYQFKKLTAEQATKLSEYIGLNKVYKEPKTLADVYEEKEGKQLIDIDDNSKKIGF
jgi:hypothetical protein